MNNLPPIQQATTPTVQKTTQKNTGEVFVYRGTNSSGQKISGTFVSTNSATAKLALNREGIQVTSIIAQNSLQAWLQQPIATPFSKHTITSQHIQLLLQQLATIIQADMDTLTGINILLADTQQPRHAQRTLHNNAHVAINPLQSLLINIKQHLVLGHSLSSAMHYYPQYFDAVVVALVSAGEQTGNLGDMLAKSNEYLQKKQAINNKIKQAIRYPIIVLAVTLITSIVLLTLVVPTFASIFASFDSELPYITQVVIHASYIMQNYWWLIISMLLLVALSGRYAYRRNQQINHGIYRVLLRLPKIGSLLQHGMHVRFCQTLASTYSAGLPLSHAVPIAVSCTNQPLLLAQTNTIVASIKNGISLSQTLQSTGLFTIMLVQMLRVGEQSDKLAPMLSSTAEHYQQQFNNSITAVLSVIEPIMIITIGAFIGLLVVAMYLPIFTMGTIL